MIGVRHRLLNGGQGIVALLFIVLLMLLRAPGRAEGEYISYDFTHDRSGYGRAVAAMNRNTSVGGSASGGRMEARAIPQTIMCRTSGAELELVTDGLTCALAGPRHCYTLYYDSLRSAQSALEQYRAFKDIIYAELDGEVTACGTDETSTRDFNSWGAREMGYGEYLNYIGRWGKSETVVAVIDSGVCRHPLLDSRITQSGYDYIDLDDDATNDLFGHGTHVAGIVADCTYGLPVYIYPIRVLDDSGKGQITNVVNAVEEACGMGVDVINLSLESKKSSEMLDDAIRDAVSRNITVVVAAGNSATDTSSVCPAHLTDSGVIVVGASEKSGDDCVRASYSNYGDSVDVYAYGTNINSCAIDGGYVLDRGTSMAAPHVSALSAMLYLIHGGISPASIESRVVAAAEDKGAVNLVCADRMVPKSTGFSLEHMTLRKGEKIPLPASAIPLTSMEAISYESDKPGVADVRDGGLVALDTGTAQITASCTGFDTVTFQVKVLDEASGLTLTLPAALTALEDEAFMGAAGLERVTVPRGLESLGNHVFDDCDALRFVSVPDSVDQIGDNGFSGAVLLCDPDSRAVSYAEENDLQYICVAEEHTAGDD